MRDEKILKMLILAFEVIVQPPKHTFEIKYFFSILLTIFQIYILFHLQGLPKTFYWKLIDMWMMFTLGM